MLTHRLLIATYGGERILVPIILPVLPIMLLSGSFLLVILLGLFSHLAQSSHQTIRHVRYAPIAHSARPRELRRLSTFRQAPGNSRIVMLGEQDHGDGTTFLAKTRLITFAEQKDLTYWLLKRLLCPESGLEQLASAPDEQWEVFFARQYSSLLVCLSSK
jgi:hypothetical protein